MFFEHTVHVVMYTIMYATRWQGHIVCFLAQGFNILYVAIRIPLVQGNEGKCYRIGSVIHYIDFLLPFPQDEYSIFPQSYSVGIHGYVLVYAVTSAKRYNCYTSWLDFLLEMFLCCGHFEEQAFILQDDCKYARITIHLYIGHC